MKLSSSLHVCLALFASVSCAAVQAAPHANDGTETFPVKMLASTNAAAVSGPAMSPRTAPFPVKTKALAPTKNGQVHSKMWRRNVFPIRRSDKPEVKSGAVIKPAVVRPADVLAGR